MKLFESLNQNMRPSDVVTITVAKTEDQMVVKVNTVSNQMEEAARPSIKPFMVKNTAEVLDNELGDILAEPLKIVGETLTDIETYRAEAKKAAEEAKKNTAAKVTAIAKTPAKTANPETERKNRFNAAINKGDKLVTEKKWDEAIAAFTEAHGIAKDDKEKKMCDNRISSVQTKRNNSMSFDFFDETAAGETAPEAEEEVTEEAASGDDEPEDEPQATEESEESADEPEDETDDCNDNPDEDEDNPFED